MAFFIASLSKNVFLCVNLPLFSSICKTAGSHSLSQLVVTWRRLCCSLCFQHFYEWLRLHNERERERGRTALRPTSALSQQLRWIPRVVAIPGRVTPPWLTSLDMEGARRSRMTVWGGSAWEAYINTQAPAYCASAPVATFLPVHVVYWSSLENTRTADKRLWEPDSMHLLFWHLCGNLSFCARQSDKRPSFIALSNEQLLCTFSIYYFLKYSYSRSDDPLCSVGLNFKICATVTSLDL